jgi:non-canonical purine NTP pyrophosphatase (RdgB/HAM1 family)
MTLFLVTSNVQKAQLVQALLDRPVRHVALDLPELQDIHVHNVIEHKVRAAYAHLEEPVLVEDTSLSFQAWNGLPGALIRWFLDTVGVEGICKMLHEYEQLEASAEVCLGYCDGETFRAFSAAIAGHVVRTPRGENGFGWDPLFVPQGWNKTFAQMTEREKEQISLRKGAVQELRRFLEEQGK